MEEHAAVHMQMLLRGVNAVGYTSYPDNVVNSFVREAHTAGIDIFRVFDSLNYLDNLLFGLDAVRAAGGVAEGTLCYSGDLCNPNKRKVKHILAHPVLVCACTSHGATHSLSPSALPSFPSVASFSWQPGWCCQSYSAGCNLGNLHAV